MPLINEAGADWIVPGSLMFGEDPAAMRQWLATAVKRALPMLTRLETALAEVPILDVHTHLVGGKLAARGLHDILLYHMVVSDLYAAGCPSGGAADAVSRLARRGGGPRADRRGPPLPAPHPEHQLVLGRPDHPARSLRLDRADRRAELAEARRADPRAGR